MSVKILAVIPARFASTRFPGKPLAMIDDKPMIQWVYEAAIACPAFQRVVVATDDQRIVRQVQEFGGVAELTSCDHETGTDRVAEVAERYPDFDVVANIQGDQPFVTPDILQRLVAPYVDNDGNDSAPEMSTVACPLEPEHQADSNVVKVICDCQMNAIYFSRAAIPYFRNQGSAPVYHHLGLYAFRSDFLRTFKGLPSTPLEQIEGLEQLRAIEHQHRIAVGLIEQIIHEVNVPEDLAFANAICS